MGKGFILWRGFAEGGEDRAAGDPRFAGIRGRSPRRRLRRRACGAHRYPLPMAAERSGEAYGANRIISRTSQGDIPGRGSVKGACRRKSLQKAPYPAMIKGRSI